MNRSPTLCLLFSGLIVCVISVCALLVNLAVYKFPGNNYLPFDTTAIGLFIIFIYAGFSLLFPSNHSFIKMTRTLGFFYLSMLAIGLLTNAVQFTPFPPIDHYIVVFEHRLGINMASIVKWTSQHPLLRNLAVAIYDSLPTQMSFLPIMMIVFMRLNTVLEYCSLMLISAIIGFTLYYFFPTTAPASVISSPFFTTAQHATGIKFAEIHHYITPSTLQGGMIALPSFHVIWAWFCLYLVRGVPLFFWLLLPVNTVLVISCVFLGWHYPIDVAASIIIIYVSHKLYNQCAII